MKATELIEQANLIYGLKAEIKERRIMFYAHGNLTDFYVFPLNGKHRVDGDSFLEEIGRFSLVSLLKLMELIDEYIATPMDERGFEKRYKLRLKSGQITSMKYLYNTFDTWDVEGIMNLAGASYTKYIFTEDELKDIDEFGYEREEVV